MDLLALFLVQVMLHLSLGAGRTTCQRFTKARERRLELHGNATAIEYWVSPNGQDSQDCLSHSAGNVSCKTIKYIIQNQCEDDKHLYIRLSGQKNFTYSEPCWDGTVANASNTSNTIYNVSYPCYITISGDVSNNRPQLTCERSDSNAKNPRDNINILSHFLTLSPPTMGNCPIPYGIKEEECNYAKLKINNVNIQNFNIHYRGKHRIIAHYVHFDNVYVTSEPNSESSCYFSCKGCKFSYVGNINKTDYMLNFKRCSTVKFSLQDTVLSSVKIYISFLYSINITLNGMSLSQLPEQENIGSQIILQQIEHNSLKESTAAPEPTLIVINNMTVKDSDVEEDEADFNAIISINLINSMNQQSKVIFINSSCSNSSPLLDYVVREGNLTSNLAKPLADHSIALQGLHIVENVGFLDIIRIVNFVNVSVNVDTCSFSKNLLQNQASARYETNVPNERIHSTAILSIQITEGKITLTDSVFDSNVGSLGGAFYLETTQFFTSSLNVYNTTCLNNDGFGGCMFIKSNVLDVFIEECIFNGNRANDAGGAIYMRSITLLYEEKVSRSDNTSSLVITTEPTNTLKSSNDLPPNYVKFNIYNSSFQNNKAFTYGGAIMFDCILGKLQLNMESVIFENNRARGAGGSLAIVGEGFTEAVWKGCKFLSNTVDGFGSSFRHFGGSVLYSNQSIKTLWLDKGDISGNFDRTYHNPHVASTFVIREAAIINFTLENMVISQNNARYPGSGVLLIEPLHPISLLSITVNIIKCKIFNNTGRLLVGIMTVMASDAPTIEMIKIFIYNTTISNNKCPFYGVGAIFIRLSRDFYVGANFVLIIVTDSNFTGNEGRMGGAIRLDLENANANVYLVNSLFIDNYVQSRGGALNIRVWEDSNILISVTDSNFTGNEGRMGGAIRLDLENANANVYLVNSLFIDNYAQSRGGALSIRVWEDSNILISVTDSNFTGNEGRMGGAIRLDLENANANVSLVNSLFIDNYAQSRGGALNIRVWEDSNILISVTDSNFTGNEGRMGGAIRLDLENANANVSLVNSLFIDNYAQSRGGALSIRVWEDSNILISVTDSNFTGNEGCMGGAIRLDLENANANVSLVNSLFIDNYAQSPGGALSIGVREDSNEKKARSLQININIKEVNFLQNMLKSSSNVKGSGAALHVSTEDMSYRISVQIETVICHNNTSDGHGGALGLSLPASDSSVFISDCEFKDNQAGRINQGGAIYLYFKVNTDDDNTEMIPPKVLINNCSFAENIAGQGGSVYQASSSGINGTLTVNNTKFFCCSSKNAKNYAQNGSLVFASLSTNMNHVSFHEVPSTDNSICPVPGLILDNTGEPHLLENIDYKCDNTKTFLQMRKLSSETNDLESRNNTNQDPTVEPLDSLMLFCTLCSFKPYTAGNGTVNISNNIGNKTSRAFKSECSRDIHEDSTCNLYGHYIETKSPCFPCPFGGDCSKRNIKAQPNYWGYEHDGFTVFQTCPQGYCCNGIDVPCETYNTCALHRKGRLCGECEPGYTESLMSRTCIPNEECNDWWIYPAAFLLALSYLIWYMYKGDLLPGFELLMIKVYSYKSASKNIIHVKSADASKSEIRYSERLSANESDKGRRIDNGYFDIIVYFVNIISVLKVKVEFQSSNTGDGILYYTEKYFTKYLDVDMQQVANVTVCPFPGINAITKYLSRPAFVLMILIIWVTLYLLSSLLIALYSKRKKTFVRKVKCFKVKLIEGYVETMKYSYSGLAGVTFIYLTCLGIGEEYFWKYNAEIKCLSTWQYGVIVLATIYTVPFSITTILGGKLLQKGQIGYIQFMIACFVPLPFLIYWLAFLVFFKYAFGKGTFSLKSLSKSTRNLLIGRSQDGQIRNEGTISEKAQVILDAYQGPYRDENSSWEGVIELRKLLFNTYYLINNNIYRLSLCTFTAVIILVHHNLVKPFKNDNSNRAETLSLSLLCMACVTNSIKTVFIESGILIYPNTPTEQLLYLMNRLDRMMIIILVAYVALSELYYTVKKFTAKKKH